MSKEKHEELLAWMRARGLDAYGSHIPGSKVREVLGLTMPDTGTFKEFRDLALVELQATGYVRGELLKQGKYLKGERGDYRILLPSENAEQVAKYREEATRKVGRAALLESTTPMQPNDDVRAKAQREARLHMQADSLREDGRRSRLLSHKGKRPRHRAA